MTGEKKSFQYGASVLLFSAIIVKLIGALFKIPLSSNICLGDLGFGYFSTAYDFFTPLYSLAMAGLPVAVAKAVSEHTAKGEYRDVRALLKISRRVYFIAGVLGFALMAALVFPVARLNDPTGGSIYSLLLITPSVLFCCVMSALRGYYEGLNNMLPTAVSEVLEALSKLVLGFGLGFITVRATGSVIYGAAAAIGGITAGTALAALYLRLYYKFKGDGITGFQLENAPPARNAGHMAKSLIMIAIPVALASLVSNIALIADSLTVKWQLAGIMESSAETVREMYANSFAAYNSASVSAITDGEIPTLLYGIRGKAYTLYNLVPAFTTVLGVSAVPVIAGLNAENDRGGVIKNINSVLKFSAVISFPIGMGFIAASGRIMDLLYDSAASVEIGGPLLAIFGAAALFSGLVIPLTGILQALGKQKAALLNIAAGTVVKILSGVIMGSSAVINIKGAAASTALCYAVICILHFLTLIKSAKILPDIRSALLKPFLAAALCGAAAYIVLRLGNSSAVTVFAIFIAAIIYFATLILENTFDESDFSSLPKGDLLLKFCKKHRIIR